MGREASNAAPGQQRYLGQGSHRLRSSPPAPAVSQAPASTSAFQPLRIRIFNSAPPLYIPR